MKIVIIYNVIMKKLQLIMLQWKNNNLKCYNGKVIIYVIVDK